MSPQGHRLTPNVSWPSWVLTVADPHLMHPVWLGLNVSSVWLGPHSHRLTPNVSWPDWVLIVAEPHLMHPIQLGLNVSSLGWVLTVADPTKCIQSQLGYHSRRPNQMYPVLPGFSQLQTPPNVSSPA